MTEDIDADRRRDVVERIGPNARALEDLIEHLRPFSSLESGRVVDLHGGEVGVDSAPGEGATFRFTLPQA